MPIPIIIQGGKHGNPKDQGLAIAAKYYQQFPLEPSPAGNMDLTNANSTIIEDITFEKLLLELAKAAGGTALIVCHAYDEYGSTLKSSGLYMPLARDSGFASDDDAFQRLLEALEPNQRAKTIRAMPESTDQEKNAKSQAWIGLATDFSLGFPPDNAKLPALAKFFENGFDKFARGELGLAGGAASLRRLLALIENVQSRKIDRVEFRACNIGKDTGTLNNLKKVFGCNKLVAPKAKTFYLDRMPITNLDGFDKRYINEHRGNFQGAGSRSSFKDPVAFAIDVIRKEPNVRIFWDVEYGYFPAQHMSTIKMKGEVLGMVVDKVQEHPSRYRGSAGTWHETSGHAPAWADAGTFVKEYIMTQATYTQGDPMISGLWTPGEELPWVLPNEPEYVDHLSQV